MPLISLKPSTKGITILIIAAAAIFFVCVLAYVGASKTTGRLDDKLAAMQKSVQDSQQIAKTLEDARYKFEDTKSQLRCLESSVSTQAYVPTLLQQLERLGKSVDLKVMGVRPQKDSSASTQRKLTSGAQASEGNMQAASSTSGGAAAQPGAAQSGTTGSTGAPGAAGQPGAGKAAKPQKPYDELKVNVEFEGNYMNALDLIYRFTSFQKIIAVDNLDIMPLKQNALKSSPGLTIRMTITAFVFKGADKDKAPLNNKPAPAAVAVEGRAKNAAG